MSSLTAYRAWLHPARRLRRHPDLAALEQRLEQIWRCYA